MRSIATSTLPALIFATCVILVYYLWARLWLTWLIRKARKINPGSILTSRFAVCVHVTAAVGLLCILYGYFLEPYWVQVNTIPIQTHKLKQAHFRVVQISDLHCDTRTRLEDDLPTRINALKPDIIVFTGDSLNSAAAQSLFTETLKRMEAPLGKFAVTGNWDFSYWSQLKLFDDTGFVELRSHTKRVEKDGESIVIAGLAFENGRHSQAVIDQLDTEAFNLLLYHNTSLLDYLDGKPIDLYLCGHTHGGQIALPFYGALTTLSRHGKKYEAGLYRAGHIDLYVNRGIGMEGGKVPRVRFFARPEIAVFDIGPKIP
jgi:predicted MPP superfamily phosphohydrolase/uncharacterized membrane protein